MAPMLSKIFSFKSLSNHKKSSQSLSHLPSSASNTFFKNKGDTLDSLFQPPKDVAGQLSNRSSRSSLHSTHSSPPTATTPKLRSASHASLPQVSPVNKEIQRVKNKKSLSLADQRYFLHSAASSAPGSTVASPTTACHSSSRPASALAFAKVAPSKLKEEVQGQESKMEELTESQRLTVQHDHYKRSCGTMVHPSTLSHLSKSERVLEVATGNGVWLQDLKNSSLVPPTATLHASDLFTPVQALPYHIDAFASHDVTVPFPVQGIQAMDLSEPINGSTELQMELKSIERSHSRVPTQRASQGVKVGQHESYDFINSRLLVFALSKDEWETSIDNLQDLLKPGGLLHLSEVNTEAIPARSDLPHPAIDRTNRIASKVMTTFNKESNAVQNLPTLLKSHGLTSIQSTQYLIPFGRAAVSAGNHSQAQATLGAATALGAIAALRKPFLAIGGEVGCQTEEEFDDFIKELEKEVMEIGMLFKYIMVVGQKPLAD